MENSFEKNMEELESIVDRLEKEDVELDDAITEFEKAMDLIRKCDLKLKDAEESIAKIVDENDNIVEFKE